MDRISSLAYRYSTLHLATQQHQCNTSVTSAHSLPSPNRQNAEHQVLVCRTLASTTDHIGFGSPSTVFQSGQLLTIIAKVSKYLPSGGGEPLQTMPVPGANALRKACRFSWTNAFWQKVRLLSWTDEIWQEIHHLRYRLSSRQWAHEWPGGTMVLVGTRSTDSTWYILTLDQISASISPWRSKQLDDSQ